QEGNQSGRAGGKEPRLAGEVTWKLRGYRCWVLPASPLGGPPEHYRVVCLTAGPSSFCSLGALDVSRVTNPASNSKSRSACSAWAFATDCPRRTSSRPSLERSLATRAFARFSPI